MFNITPHNQERLKPRGERVKLYYVNVEYHEAHKGFPPPVQIKQSLTVPMPKLGEYIELEAVYAKDLIFKTRYKGKDGVSRATFVSDQEGGAELAKFLKEAIKEGRELTAGEIEKVRVRKLAEATLPDEELIKILEERGYSTAAKSLLKAVKNEEEKPPEKVVESPAPVVPESEASTWEAPVPKKK